MCFVRQQGNRKDPKPHYLNIYILWTFFFPTTLNVFLKPLFKTSSSNIFYEKWANKHFGLCRFFFFPFLVSLLSSATEMDKAPWVICVPI